MPLSDRDRLDAERRAPRLIALHQALSHLRSCVSFMNSGAHPDDEVSAMLAALSFRDGIDISYACANRGEGGQNDIGTEAAAALGTLRTAEMERAAAILDLRLYWLSTHPADSIFDFGFSKRGDETLQRWGHQRTLQRFVDIVRRERPDILCPTFLDVPGQHGHHRAMTALAHEVMDRAADPTFASAGHAPPWTIAKLYLPAWGGGGSAYDDEEEPPPETLRISASGRDPVSGWSYENIGQQSRRFHLTQGMGRWISAGSERDWPLHLVRSSVSGPDHSLKQGLPVDLNALADSINALQPDAVAQQADLRAAQNAMNEAIEAFPDTSAICMLAFTALRHVQQVRKRYAQHDGEIAHDIEHRLRRKENQLGRVITLAAGVQVHATSDRDWWRPGDESNINIEVQPPDSSNVQLQVALSAATPWQVDNHTLTLGKSAEPSDPYPDSWLPDEPDGPVVELSLQHDDTHCVIRQALETPPVILPAHSLQLNPDALLINTLDTTRELEVRISQRVPDDVALSADLPAGWKSHSDDLGLTLTTPADLAEGLYEIPLKLGEAAFTEQRIQYPHVTPRVLARPAMVRVRAVPIALPAVRIAYAGSGHDRVGHWLEAMGLTVHHITDQELSDAATLQAALDYADTLVIGVFAYRMRTGLAALTPTINTWVETGGHLLTLYHRPWDAWDPDTVPPRHLEIGQPSLRYRVTDENATVNFMQQDHSLLRSPNVISAADFQGWHKERGLYFAKNWDAAYTPLLSMADANEPAHEGSLLCAKIGQGRHVHTALILHHQMEQLVPGSFRLMANLVS